MRIIKFGIVFLICVLFFSLVGAASYSSSNPNTGLFESYVRGGSSFDTSKCEAGQDFLVQIAPFGCTPAVVTSDLLEEQNVPVFCQLGATKINPLIDVEAIESISFSGQYPADVSGIGFHPAKAALGVRGDLNSPVLDNIGYVVIVLKQNKVEADMPDYVSGNLTARLKYDIDNAFGIGKATFYLPVLSDSDWEDAKNSYSFWNGNGYVRAESVGTNEAGIGVYNDLRRLGGFELEKGETSNELYLPGMECRASLKLRLDGLENPDTRAKLEINGEIVEVADEQYFLDNKCQVKRIKKDGLNEEVEFRCKEDDSSGYFGWKSYTLTKSPRVNLSIDGDQTNVGDCVKDKTGCVVGDILYKEIKILDNGTKKEDRTVFLGYIGELKKELFIVPVVTTADNREEFLSSYDADYVERFVKKEKELIEFREKKISIDKVLSYAGFFWEIYSSIVTGLARGSDMGPVVEKGNAEEVEFNIAELLRPYKTIISTFPFLKVYVDFYGDSNTFFQGYEKRKITLNGFATPYDKDILSEITKDNYENAIQDYNTLISNYGSEVYKKIPLENNGEYTVTYKEEAMVKKINLADVTLQKKTMSDFCEEFKKVYSDSEYNEAKSVLEKCNNYREISSVSIPSQDVLVDGEIKKIDFKEIYQPSKEEYSAVVKIKGYNEPVVLGKEEVFYLSPEDNEYIQLIDLDDDSAKFKVNLKKKSLTSVATGAVSNTGTLGLDKIESFDSDYTFTLTKVNLKKYAKVSVIPGIENAGTSANFSFKIGIEKRAIQLSPEKTQEKIDNLEATIAKWSKISDNLGNVVKTMKGACFATSAVLMVKNFIANTGGKAIARQKVMREEGGWYDKCSDLVNKEKKFSSIDECLFENSKNIDAEVDALYNLLETQQTTLKAIDKDCKVDSSWEFITEKQISTNCFKVNYIENLRDGSLNSDLKKLFGGSETVTCNDKKVNIDNFVKNNLNESYTSVDDLQDIGLYSKSGTYDTRVKEIICDIYVNSNKEVQLKLFESEIGYSGSVGTFTSQNLKDISVTKYTKYKDVKNKYSATGIADEDNVYFAMDESNGKSYMFVFNDNGAVQKTFLISGTALSLYKGEDLNDKIRGDENNPFKLKFKLVNSASYENAYTNAEAKFYETEPYAGLPAIVPFDLDKGWYAYVRQTVGVWGKAASYDESAAVANYYVCNVGENGREEGWSGDDDCTGINTGSGTQQTIGGLDASYSTKVINTAKRAIEDAARQRQKNSGIKTVYVYNLEGKRIPVKVGNPYADISDLQCQDFMSPSDCKLMFNLCDPVICPSSRCDFGGAYPVKDVIQSGIIGSIALCLPNINEGIYIPVCLSGIKAGIDSLLSVYQSYHDCLQESLDSGETVGICDEIHSIYLCEFFWKQATPLAKIAIPKILEVVFGQNIHGGGEYLGVSSAWTSSQKSVEYFTQYYAANSFEAFKSRTTDEVGGEICRNFASGVYPEGGNVLDALTDPDSPPQFYGRFEENSFTTATVPPVSHYKVFYHIYAGEDSRVYYQVYLRGSSTSSYYQDVDSTRLVDSGYISKGEYASQTKDFTAPSGYNELCIRVNDQLECGFQQATTSYAVNYVTDEYVASQATETDIKTEKECISGSASVYSLLNLNVQGGAEDLIETELNKYGITRVCATTSPGKGTDKDYNNAAARWVEVGYCDDENIKCWIDRQTVKDVIKNLDIENETISNLSKTAETLLGDLKTEDYDAKLKEIEGATGNTKIGLINELLGKVYLNSRKSKLFLLRADEYNSLASGAFRKEVANAETATPPEGDSGDDGNKDSGQDETGSIDCSARCKSDGFYNGYFSSKGTCEKTSHSLVKINEGEFCCCYSEEDAGFVDKVKEIAGNLVDFIRGGEELNPDYACSSLDDCRKIIGNEILKIIKEGDVKNSYNIDDAVVKSETGADCFEELVLMQAMQESSLTHCKDPVGEGNALYCDGTDNVVGVGNSESSVGVMQINTNKHSGDFTDFGNNVLKGLTYLSEGYNSGNKIYECYPQSNYKPTNDFYKGTYELSDFTNKIYSGWERALRNYNGWNEKPNCINATGSIKGDPFYVDNVLARKSQIEDLFGNVCG